MKSVFKYGQSYTSGHDFYTGLVSHMAVPKIATIFDEVGLKTWMISDEGGL